MKIIDGGVTAAKGFKAAAAAAEIKYKGRTDMAMVYSEVPCVAAGTFTTNVVKAAPVKWDQDIVYNHPSAQVVICNSGIANACTGAEGYGYCKETADAAAEILGVAADLSLIHIFNSERLHGRINQPPVQLGNLNSISHGTQNRNGSSTCNVRSQSDV